MAPIPEITADIHRDLGKIQATLDEILRRLDKHAENEDKIDARITVLEAQIRRDLEKSNSRLSAIETRMHYALGVFAAALFFFEVVLKFVKV